MADRRSITPNRVLVPALVALMLSGAEAAFAGENESREAVVTRVTNDITFLASDALEGRGIDTPGIETAAQHIITEYKRLGLKPGMPDESYRQSFPVTMGDVVVAGSTGVTLHGPDGTDIRLELGRQYQPVRRGANGSATGELVFIGYGITSAEDNYNDYADIDVTGKILVLIRREPRQGQDGAFSGKQTSSHSYIDRKMTLINESKAAGIIFVNDTYSSPTADKDELTPPAGFGNESSSVPFVHVKQSVVDQILAASPLTVGDTKLGSLAEVAARIDQTLQPVSQPLPGWSADISTQFEANTISTDNIIGIIEGEGDNADETIVIGAHYDHLGYGGFGSRAPNRKGEIHNGADDNATGTAAVLELARRVALGQKPNRRMIFICFSAEERGLIGSNYYVRNPVVPLPNTVFMMNFDMIGNLRDNRVEVNGVGTAAEFAELVRKADEASPLDISIVENPFGGSDHLPFYQKNIPVMFCFTGLTGFYQTPDDDSAGLNMEGAVSVIDYSEQLLRLVDQLPSRPTFTAVSRTNRRPRSLPFLGLSPELADYDGEGVLIRSVRSGSPAEQAGIQVGDIILKMGDRRLDGYQNLIEILTSAKPGDKVKVVFKRGDQEVEATVTLGAPQR